jgi:exopolysaccharide production protein ExoZ
MAFLLTGVVTMKLPWSRAPFSWLVRAGDASYSIYLLHYIVFLLSAIFSAAWLPSALGLTLPAWACEPFRFAAILLCSLISYATYRLIERPAIGFSERLTDARAGPTGYRSRPTSAP